MVELRPSSPAGDTSSDEESFDLIDNIIEKIVDENSPAASPAALAQKEHPPIDEKKKEQKDNIAERKPAEADHKTVENTLLNVFKFSIVLLAVFLVYNEKATLDSMRTALEENRVTQANILNNLERLLIDTTKNQENWMHYVEQMNSVEKGNEEQRMKVEASDNEKLTMTRNDQEKELLREELEEKDAMITRLKEDNAELEMLVKDAINNHGATNTVKDKEINELKLENTKCQTQRQVTARNLAMLEEIQRNHNEAIDRKNMKLDKEKRETKKVKLIVKDGSFGFAIRKQSILKVHSGFPADLAGIKRGDQIVSINGINVETFTHEKMMEVVRKAKVFGSIALELRENTEPLNSKESLWNKAS